MAFCLIHRKDRLPLGCVTWRLWFLVLGNTCCIPPGHLWQQSLVRAVDRPRQREGSIAGSGEVRNALLFGVP